MPDPTLEQLTALRIRQASTGATAAELAAEVGISLSRYRCLIKAHGLIERYPVSRHYRWPPQRLQRLIEMAKDATLPELAETFDTTVYSVMHALQASGARWKVVRVQRRALTEEHTLALRLRRIEGETVQDLAAEAGVTTAVLYRLWQTYGHTQSHPLRPPPKRWTIPDIRLIHAMRSTTPPTEWADIGAHFGVSARAARHAYEFHKGVLR